VRGASLAFDDGVSGKIQSLELYPSIRALLTGNLSISRMEVASLALSLRLHEPGEEPIDIDEIEAQIRSLLTLLAATIPGMTRGSVEVNA
jgi:hypothetical protein